MIRSLYSKCRSALIASVLSALACVPVAHALETDEANLKAAYILNFGRYVEWPSLGAPGSPFNICVIGNDAILVPLRKLEGKTVQQRAVAVKTIERGKDARECQIVYISGGERARLATIFQELDNAPVLTVSDIENFTKSGGMIGFVSAESRLQMIIQLARARGAKLNVSSSLLRLAVVEQ